MRRAATTLIGVVVALVAIGLVMLASTSGVRSESAYSTPYYFVIRQIVWLVMAMAACLVFARVDYRWLRRLSIPILVVTALLLVATLVPGVGRLINGSRRWLALGPANLQASELAKFSVILFLASRLHPLLHEPEQTIRRIAAPFSVVALMLGLIFFEPDYGTTMLVALVAGAMMFVAGVRVRYLLVTGATGVMFFVLMLMMDEERMTRILAFLDPMKYAKDEAFQLLNALYAFVTGGLRGSGLGLSLQKHFFLPECHTDFILPIIGEELGLTASLGVLALFIAFFFSGMAVAARTRDNFGRLLAFGITLMIGLQATINIAVVTGCLPTKGLALPFISYGGSSLVVSGVLLGVLINIARQNAPGAPLATGEDLVKDRIRSI
jgi:cell division protein FtsW